MTTTRFALLLATLAVAVTTVLSSTTVIGSRVVPAVPRPALSGGASSMDELLGRFVAAIAANDRDALEALRVTEDEYRRGILPWSVAPGQEPQGLSAEADEYFWQVLDTKSAFHRQGLLVRFGGHVYEIAGVAWQKGVKEWAGYRSYGRLELTLRDETGADQILNTGSVAEVDGQFKFISFIRD